MDSADSPATGVHATSEMASHDYDMKLPPFLPKDVELWFALVEARFGCLRVTSDESKFHHVFMDLEAVVVAEVRDILLNPPANDKYITLKSAIIKRWTESRSKKMMHLLLKEDIGDRTPSQFLCHLRELGDGSVTDTLLRAIWMSGLPVHVQSVIAEVASLDIEQLAAIADKVSNETTRMMSTLNSMASQIEQITKRIQQLETKQRRRSSSRRGRSTSAFRKVPQRQDGLCYFHRTFGGKARQCEDPCTFVKLGNKQPPQPKK